jgi:uncharacterized phage protein (TIGR02220 family)
VLFILSKGWKKVKYTINGFSQEQALKFKKKVVCGGKEKEIKIDATDLLILRWLVDFYPQMIKVEIEGSQYVWVQYKKILEDLPLLDIKKQALVDRLQKLCEFGILINKIVKIGGNFSYYGFGKMYQCIVDSNFQQCEGVYSTTQGVCSQLHKGVYSTTPQIDNSIKDSDIKNDIIYIVGYLNEKANVNFKPNSKKTQTLLKGLLTTQNYSVEDCISVIDKKCSCWLGTEFAKYLRPETLFGNKFESYLNEHITLKKQKKNSFDSTVEELNNFIENDTDLETLIEGTDDYKKIMGEEV